MSGTSSSPKSTKLPAEAFTTLYSAVLDLRSKVNGYFNKASSGDITGLLPLLNNYKGRIEALEVDRIKEILEIIDRGIKKCEEARQKNCPRDNQRFLYEPYQQEETNQNDVFIRMDFGFATVLDCASRIEIEVTPNFYFPHYQMALEFIKERCGDMKKRFEDFIKTLEGGIEKVNERNTVQQASNSNST